MKNRSQTELAEGTSLAEARTTERRYFESHDLYAKLPPNLVGHK
jgi:Dynamin central region